MYIGTLVLTPPSSELASRAMLAHTMTQFRLPRSARMPEGTSSSGTTAAYAAAMTPTEAAVNPICDMNSFSTGTHRSMPCSPTASCSGSSRRASVRGVGPAATARLTGGLLG